VSLALPEPTNVLYRLKRGVTSYVSYLAACEMNEAFSEYVLYEPILRILTARGYLVSCEVVCPGIQHATIGDKKRLDFVATRKELALAIEVKWVKQRAPSLNADLAKLESFVAGGAGKQGFLCVFGRKSHTEQLVLPKGRFTERGRMVTADLGKTRYSCRIFQLLPGGR
jgi:hypothetical protein